MSFGKAILSGYRNTFNFTGKASLDEYWWFVAWELTLAIAMGGGAVAGVLVCGIPPPPGASMWPLYVLTAIPGIAAAATILPVLTAQIRRVRDSGRSGLWVGAWWAITVAQAVLTIATKQEKAATLCGLVAGGLSLFIFVWTVQPSRKANAS